MDIGTYPAKEHRPPHNPTSLTFKYQHNISSTWGFGLQPLNAYWHLSCNLLLNIGKPSNFISVVRFKGVVSPPGITTTHLYSCTEGLFRVGHLKLCQPFNFSYAKPCLHQICASST